MSVTQKNRLPSGGRINREQEINFRFNGWSYVGYEGDTLASALLANNVHLIGRSPFYHRPRGIFSANVSRPNPLVQIQCTDDYYEFDQKPSLIPIYDGLSARSQNGFPSLENDILAVNDHASSFLPPKIFDPAFRSKLYVSYLNKLLKNKTKKNKNDPFRYDFKYDYCDILVIGSSPASLCAARMAAESGARVILAFEDNEAGGALLSENQDKIVIDGQSPTAWRDSILTALADCKEITILPKTAILKQDGDDTAYLLESVNNHMAAEQIPAHSPRQRLRHVKTKAIIRPSVPSEKPLPFNNNDRPGIMLAGAVRSYLNRYAVIAGQTPAILTNNNSAYRTAFDLADAGIKVAAIIDVRPAPPQALLDQAKEYGIEVLNNHSITNTQGRAWVNQIFVKPISESGSVDIDSEARAIDCDLLCVSGGWDHYETLRSSINTGLESAKDALGKLKRTSQDIVTPDIVSDEFDLDTLDIDVLPTDIAAEKAKIFTDIYTDATYTVPHTGIILPEDEDLLEPLLLKSKNIKFKKRKSPLYNDHKERGAVFVSSDDWKIPAYYKKTETETEEKAIPREAWTVRNKIGIYDAGTSHVVDVGGNDAEAFLKTIIAGDGDVPDAGQFARVLISCHKNETLHEALIACHRAAHYTITLPSTQDGHVVDALLESCGKENFGFNVCITDVSDQWGMIRIAGPDTRNTIHRISDDIKILQQSDISFFEVRYGHICGGVPVQIYCDNYLGTLSLDLYVPNRYSSYVWQKVFEAGEDFGVIPFGLFALDMLRAEKGLPGQMNCADHTIGNDIVGLVTQDPKVIPPKGAPIFQSLAKTKDESSLGHVVAAYISPNTGRSITLAKLDGGMDHENARLAVGDSEPRIPVRVTSPVFFDPEGERIDG